MELGTWLTVLSICALGAMSPGPSLAVVLRHTLHGGRGSGALTGIAHGAGVGLYSFASISGVGLLLTTSPRVFQVFEWAGALYLAWLGLKGLMARPHAPDQPPPSVGGASAIRDGFLIVFLNPKVAVFFLALFSQVVGPDTSFGVRLVYAATAWIVDTVWYVLVAWLFSNPRWLASLQRKSVWLERLFGVVLILLAARLLFEVVR